MHIHYNSNTNGKDYIIGDLHGMYDELMHALTLLKFNKSTDRLFSVGDLIDRGPKSFECANLIYEDWFHMVIGNHEQMMMHTILDQHLSYYHMWMNNGGLWHISENDQLLEDISQHFKKLPLIISVGTEIDRFNIVHGELLLNQQSSLVTDKDIDEWTFNPNDVEDMTWGRTLINLRSNLSYNLQDAKQPCTYKQDTKLSPTYCGHSTVKAPCKIEQQIYLDTGFSYSSKTKYPENYPLSIACPQENNIYQYTNIWKKLTHTNISNIQTYK